MANLVDDYFNFIYDRLFHKVTCYVIVNCSSISDVEDIVQEVFTELYKLIKSKGVNYLNSPEAMVMRIANFKLQRYYKSKKAQRTELAFHKKNAVEEEGEAPDVWDINVEKEYINAETVKEIWNKLKKKPVETQKIFALYYYCDKTLREIALMLRVSESQVKHRLYGTIKEIRNIYLKAGELS